MSNSKPAVPGATEDHGGEFFGINPHMLCKDKDALARSTCRRDFHRLEKDRSGRIGHSNCTVRFQESLP